MTLIELPMPRMLYATDDERPLSTHSMLKTFRRCPKQADYKYAQRLKPKSIGKPLRRGTWFHALLEAHHGGNDWKPVHQEFSAKFSGLFDEEKDKLGDLPSELAHLMRSYLWHYANASNWIVHEVEMVLEATFPDGSVYRGKIDALVEDDYGLWIVDHKTHKRLPGISQQLRDAQSALYLWAADRMKIPVKGFIWNYVKTEAIGRPVALKDGSRLSKNSPSTDYPTLARFVKDEAPHMKAALMPELRRLHAERYDPEKIQTSPFFRRDVLVKTPELIEQVVREAYRTSGRMHEYDFSQPGVERVPDRSCDFMCSYQELCIAELIQPDSPYSRNIRRQHYTVGDPNDYYQDEKETGESAGVGG